MRAHPARDATDADCREHVAHGMIVASSQPKQKTNTEESDGETMMDGNLFAALCAGKPCDATALIDGWDAPISYAKIAARSGRLAARLVALDVEPGDRIAIRSKRAPGR